MKKILLAVGSLAVFPLWAQSPCNKKIDPSKVMLFVDTNNSELEIETTRKAACERGEHLMVVPKNYKEYGKYTGPFNEATKRLERCLKKPGNVCANETSAVKEATSKMGSFIKSQPQIQDGIREALNEIKAKNGKLQVFTISGHDGGGHFGGNKGGFGRQELQDIMKDYEDINNTSSILLLGCYTGVQKEIYAWKNIFPKARVIAGYDGAAPLADRPQGHQYLSDILLKEKQLLSQADEKKLVNFTKNNFQAIDQLHAAMYINCEDDKEFYFGNDGTRKTFKTFNTKECLEKKSEVQAISQEFQKYNSGELEPPLNTQGALRQLYNKARRLEHCVEQLDVDLDVNALFNLLFYQGVKENFAAHYKDDLEEAAEILKDLNPTSMAEAMDQSIKDREAGIATQKERLEQAEKNPDFLIAEAQKAADDAKAEVDKLLNDPSFAHLRSMVDANGNYISTVLNPPEEDRIKLTKLMHATSHYRYESMNAKHVKENIQMVIQEMKQSLEFSEKSLDQMRLSHKSIKESMAKNGVPVWVPTKENLTKKTRKELLQNLHDMNALLSADALTDKQAKTVRWLNTVQANHLQYFQNPFSWHEYTGHTEGPQNSFPLSSFMNPGMSSGGLFGPMTTPGMGLQIQFGNGGFIYQGGGLTGGGLTGGFGLGGGN